MPDKLCSTCPLARTIDRARHDAAASLMDARSAARRLREALAMVERAYADLADATQGLRPEGTNSGLDIA